MTNWDLIADILDEIGKTSSTNDKKNILRTKGDFEDFKIVLKLAYDPYIKFYVARVDTIHHNAFFGFQRSDLYDISQFLEDLEALSERIITGFEALAHVSKIYNILPIKFKPYLEKILKKDLKIGLATGLINDVFPELISEFKLALCERFKKIKIERLKFPLLAEPKIDGIRALAFITDDGVEIKARSGIVFDNFKVIEQELLKMYKERFKPYFMHSSISEEGIKRWEDGVVIDGEIQDKNFKTTMNNARRKYDVQCNNAIFKIWDILPTKEFLEEQCTFPLGRRKGELLQLFCDPVNNKNGYSACDFLLGADGYYDFVYSHLKLVEWDEVYNFNEIIEMFEYWFNDRNEEGIIVKDPNSYYQYSAGNKRGGQNAVWWKFKRQDYAEYLGEPSLSEYTVKCTGYYSGEKGTKYEEILGGFTYEFEAELPNEDKNLGKTGPMVTITGRCGGGLTDSQRSDFWNRREELVGKLFDVESQEISMNKKGEYSLRFLTFKGFREDI